MKKNKMNRSQDEETNAFRDKAKNTPLGRERKGSKKDKVESKNKTSPCLEEERGECLGGNEDEMLDMDNKEYVEVGPVKRGMRKLKDILAPSGFDRKDEDCIGVGGKYVRSFVVNGYPNAVQVGWLDSIYNTDEDMDVSFHVTPTDERSSLDEINLEITKQEAQLQHEYKSGNIKNLSRLENKISQLYEQRARLEQNLEKMYHSCIVSNLHASSKEELDKATYRLKHTLGARKIDIKSLYLRQDEGYQSALPYGINNLDEQRSINTGGIVASFPFYNSQISHPNGVFLGLNMVTGTPMFLDMYDRNLLNNGNMTVFGASGSGKTFLVSLLTARSIIKGISTAIVDPEGEYIGLAKELGGVHISVAPGSSSRINPMDLYEEFDDKKNKKVVNVKGKISDVLNLIAIMNGGLDSEQRSVVSLILKDLYNIDWGITEDPESLFTKEESYNPVTKEFIHAGERKVMPTFSDFYEKLKIYVNENPQQNLKSLVNSLKIYTKGNVYDLWDCQTSEDLKHLGDYPVIVFDVSALEDQMLRTIGMQSSLTWIWESFVKKDHVKKKRIIVDEAWMMVDPTMAGSEYTASFLNVAARRCRKRQTGLLVASQSFHEFVDNPMGLAVLMNSSVNMLLKTEPIAIDAVQQTFKLSDGERNFLMSAQRGQVLIRMNGESCVGYIMPFEYEKRLIENPFAKKIVEEDEYNYEDEYDYEDE